MNGYPSDLTVEQYEAIKNLLPKSSRLGRSDHGSIHPYHNEFMRLDKRISCLYSPPINDGRYKHKKHNINQYVSSNFNEAVFGI